MNAEQAIAQFLKTLPSAAGATFLALFPIVNPIGGIPMFFTLTSGYPDKDRAHAALKTAFYVFALSDASCMSSKSPSIEKSTSSEPRVPYR